MVYHRIIWKLKEELTLEEKTRVKANAKAHLQELVGVIDGLISLNVITDLLAGSSGDMMLDSCFESEEALRAYSAHPAHQAVANTYVRPFTASRACVDYEV